MKYTHAILGGTGHIGSVLAETLLQQQQSVLVIGHDATKADEWTVKGAGFETADLSDSEGLKRLFRQAERVFILNPPAPPDSDTDAVEQGQIRVILDALQGLKHQKIVAASTYGAQKAEHLYDLGTLYDLEAGLKQLHTPLAIIRSAYYMSNFDQTIPSVREKQQLVTLFPGDFKLPMVAPEDIGKFAAELMQDDRTGLFFIEGPEHYSNQDAAGILSQLLHKNIVVVTVPGSDWKDFLMQGGFSEQSAASFSNMIRLTISQQEEHPDAQHGPTSLGDYLQQSLQKAAQPE